MNTVTMENVLNKKKWNAGVVQLYVEPPQNPLIKSKHGDKLEKYFVKIKLHRDPTSEKSDIHEFKMDLSDNDNPEDCFCSFVISTLLSRCQERFRLLQISNTF